MAKTKVRKDKKPFKPKSHDQILNENFKMKQEHQEKQIAKIPPPEKDFQELPSWDKASSFQVTGAEFDELYAFYQMFSPMLKTIENIFHRGVAKGLIKPIYLKQDGSHASEEEVKKYQQELMEYMKKVQELRGVKPSPIVGVNGEALSSESEAEDIPDEKPEAEKSEA
jgi:hypothetical protein